MLRSRSSWYQSKGMLLFKFIAALKKTMASSISRFGLQGMTDLKFKKQGGSLTLNLIWIKRGILVVVGAFTYIFCLHVYLANALSSCSNDDPAADY